MGSVCSEKSSLYSGRNSLRCSFVLNYKIIKEEEENRKERRDKRSKTRTTRRSLQWNEWRDKAEEKWTSWDTGESRRIKARLPSTMEEVKLHRTGRLIIAPSIWVNEDLRDLRTRWTRCWHEGCGITGLRLKKIGVVTDDQINFYRCIVLVVGSKNSWYRLG